MKVIFCALFVSAVVWKWTSGTIPEVQPIRTNTTVSTQDISKDSSSVTNAFSTVESTSINTTEAINKIVEKVTKSTKNNNASRTQETSPSSDNASGTSETPSVSSNVTDTTSSSNSFPTLGSAKTNEIGAIKPPLKDTSNIPSTVFPYTETSSSGASISSSWTSGTIPEVQPIRTNTTVSTQDISKDSSSVTNAFSTVESTSINTTEAINKIVEKVTKSTQNSNAFRTQETSPSPDNALGTSETPSVSLNVTDTTSSSNSSPTLGSAKTNQIGAIKPPLKDTSNIKSTVFPYTETSSSGASISSSSTVELPKTSAIEAINKPSVKDPSSFEKNEQFGSRRTQQNNDIVPSYVTESASSLGASDRSTLSENSAQISDYVKLVFGTTSSQPVDIANVSAESNSSSVIQSSSTVGTLAERIYEDMRAETTINLPSFLDTTYETTSSAISITVINITDTTIEFSWEAPRGVSVPDLDYQVAIISLGPNHTTPSDCTNTIHQDRANTSQLSYTFDQLLPDFTYSINVSTTTENETVSGNVSVTTDTAAPGQPRIIPEDLGTTKVVKWNEPCYPNGEINHYIIEYTGIHMLNKSKIHNQSHTILSSEPLELNLVADLLPLSDYNLSITAEGTNGKKGEPATTTFVTMDTIPKAPNVSIDQLTSSGFKVSWKLHPEDLANVTKFQLNITSLGAAFPQNSNCSQNPTGFIVYKLNISNFSYVFESGFPYHKYEVSVVAISSRSYGSSSDLIPVQTNSSVPESPEDYHFDIDNTNTTANISWRLPCNINGDMAYTNVQLIGAYSEDPTDKHPLEHHNISFVNQKWYYEIPDIILRESFNYTVTITIVLKDGTEGAQAVIGGITFAGIPGIPINLRLGDPVSSSSFSMVWDPPEEHKGKIIGYEVNVSKGNPLYYIPSFTDCPSGGSDIKSRKTNGSITYITYDEMMAYHSYDVYVKAETAKGYGNPSLYKVNTSQSNPEIVVDLKHDITFAKTEEKYDANVTVSFRRPCFTNGPLKKIELNYTATRDSDRIEDSITINEQDFYTFVLGLKPEYEYNYSVSVYNDVSRSTTNGYFNSPSGVPIFSVPSDYLPILQVSTDKAEIVLKRDLLNHTNGHINYVALIVATTNATGGDFQDWDGKNWPTLDNGFVQITPDRWSPFNDTTMDNITFLIGNDTTCISNEYCNTPLEPNKEYYLIVRIFSKNFYRNSPAFKFQTEKLSQVGLIVGILFGILVLALICASAFYVYRKGYWQKKIGIIGIFMKRTSEKPSESKSASIPCRKFVQYYNYLENNPEKLQEQYRLMTEKAKDIAAENTTEFAVLLENKRKNRYINICPFDQTRVKLLIDEDDEIGSDYVNASYIKGFSGQVEYIATQGPLVTTCRDFWKMVLQENVTIIVMVTQFTENDKIKCHHYFPKNHENMTISDDMEVRCATELHFGTYCVRNLQIRKDNTQVTVTHMQFLDWPDFGVPVGTENMLQFCNQLRERAKSEGGIILVHCSAGVGRTGTLIATDIILQSINAGRQIDIFNTVLELRKQRVAMVQTEKQYIYIHALLRDYLDRSPSPDLIENLDPVYENMDIIKQSETRDCDPKWKQEESEF